MNSINYLKISLIRTYPIGFWIQFLSTNTEESPELQDRTNNKRKIGIQTQRQLEKQVPSVYPGLYAAVLPSPVERGFSAVSNFLTNRDLKDAPDKSKAKYLQIYSNSI